MNDPLESGSDSFLDIIANLVGILVILVVATAVRVAKSPADGDPEPEPVAVAVEVARQIDAPVGPPEPQPIPDKPIDVYLAADDPLPPLRLAAPKPDRRLLDAIARVESELAALPQPVGVTGLTRRIALLADLDPIDSDGGLVHELTGQIEEAEAAVATQQEANEAAEVRLATVELAEDTPESLVHEIRPVARQIRQFDPKLTLYLRDDHVAVVSRDELDRKVFQSMRQRGARGFAGGLLKGRVGPVDGFTARYLVKRGGSSPIDDILGGGNGSAESIYVFYEPVARPIGLPIGQAVAPGSSLQRAMQNDRLIIEAVVYPDSFAAARQLEAAARSAGVRVSLRPQSADLPFTASSQGSAGMAQ